MAAKSSTANTAETVTATENITADAAKFTKDQIVRSRTYARNRDMLSAVLEDGKTYSKSEVDKIIENGGVV